MHALSPLQVGSRVAASLLGGYAFVFGLVTLGTTLGVLCGMAYGDAQTLVYLLAFLVFLVCFCWAYVETSTARVWSVLLGGGVALTGAGWLLSRFAP